MARGANVWAFRLWFVPSLRVARCDIRALAFMKDGLRDLSISRTTFGWGIDVPSDPDNPTAHEDHVMYVWLDALTNYLTAVGYPDEGAAEFKEYWSEGQVVHMVGKDILRFHAISLTHPHNHKNSRPCMHSFTYMHPCRPTITCRRSRSGSI